MNAILRYFRLVGVEPFHFNYRRDEYINVRQRQRLRRIRNCLKKEKFLRHVRSIVFQFMYIRMHTHCTVEKRLNLTFSTGNDFFPSCFPRLRTFAVSC